eukprot:CAMPEP_0114160134 /NCGR_PEP_ID=MMETSP0043_2-20121206/28177_1 /TAXON_ID=464988 /ORGANISM="Hemiselmis andersenii, Strain CCMP644" /LENGTH=115 /DNA_ID=CAMNT_0001256117 /DNA_START=228 /DNA_END=573 /DNA_ORIENTATION=+
MTNGGTLCVTSRKRIPQCVSSDLSRPACASTTAQQRGQGSRQATEMVCERLWTASDTAPTLLAPPCSALPPALKGRENPPSWSAQNPVQLPASKARGGPTACSSTSAPSAAAEGA